MGEAIARSIAVMARLRVPTIPSLSEKAAAAALWQSVSVIKTSCWKTAFFCPFTRRICDNSLERRRPLGRSLRSNEADSAGFG